MALLLEEILIRENMQLAYKKVKGNKGASGVDGITTEGIDEYLRENWVEIREKIRRRKYKPKPVKRVEIPKPDGGVGNLGIPTVVDRIIEQAMEQKLTPIVEPHFSEYSYGLRPGRSAQQAVIKRKIAVGSRAAAKAVNGTGDCESLERQNGWQSSL